MRGVKASIHNSGELAVDTIKRLIEERGHIAERGPRSGPNAGKTPDILFKHIDGREIKLEVKQASSSVPQLRPAAYKVTVVRGDIGTWWVIPPHELIVMALSHPGQHCVSSFECMNPGSPNSYWKKWACNDGDVVDKICLAYDAGQNSPLKNIVESIKKDIENLFAHHKNIVSRTGR